jgi:tetratricopeptide (TPR) repeat protein
VTIFLVCINALDKTLRLIIQAQTAFYNKNIDGALTLVNESLSLFKTAQGYALRGSLFYLKGNKIEAQKNWDLAIEFNPDIFIPDIEVLDQLIRTQPGN